MVRKNKTEITTKKFETFDLEALRYICRRWQPNKIDPGLKRDLEHGWMLDFLVELETIAWGRWVYWAKLYELKSLPDERIPQIAFSAEGEAAQRSLARNHLEECLDIIPQGGRAGSKQWQGWGSFQYFEYFLDWLLYGFGHSGQKELPQEPFGATGASLRLYQYFNLAIPLAWPYDYFGEILAENKYGQGRGFYPTPHNVVKAMTDMLFFDANITDFRDKTFCDPCVGTGRFPLFASNHTLRIYAQDINLVLVKACLVNGYLYAPWMVKPLPFLDSCQYNVSLQESLSATLTNTAPSPESVAYLEDTVFDFQLTEVTMPIKMRKKKGTPRDVPFTKPQIIPNPQLSLFSTDNEEN